MRNSIKESLIVTIILDRKRYSFFKRFSPELKNIGFKQIFLTNRLSIWFELRLRGENTRLIRKKNYQKTYNDKFYNSLAQCREILDLSVKKKEGLNTLYSAYKATNKIVNKYKKVNYFVWNGHSLIDMGAKIAFQEKKIKGLHFELSNIHGKLFVDKLGVNAKSFLNKNIELLDLYDDVGDEDWNKFVLEFQNLKQANHLPKQTKESKSVNKWFLVDYFGFVAQITPKDKNFDLKKITNSRSIKNKPVGKPIFNLASYKYIFFVGQVSNDTQILINSNHSQHEALIRCLKYSKEKNLKIIYRFHPAETDQDFIDSIFSFCKKHKILISIDSAYDLIKYSQEVWTINSTVGLEAQIIGKEVRYIGDSYYPKLADQRLKKFLLHYLLEIDPFSDNVIDKMKIKNIMNLMDKNET